MRTRFIITCAVAGCMLAVVSNGCSDAAKEGDPCNALIVHDECTQGTCQIIGSCTVGHCCPADPSTSTSPYCNGMACPPLPDDGGEEGAVTDAPEDSTSEAGAETGSEAAVEASPEASPEASVDALPEAAIEAATSEASSDGPIDAINGG